MDKNDLEKLGDLVKTLFIDLLDCVRKSKEENKWISSHYKFPVYIGKHKVTGMPEIRETFLSEDPKDYASLFICKDDEHHYNIEKIPSYNAVIQFFLDNESLIKPYTYFSGFDFSKGSIINHIRFCLLASFDSFVHQSGSSDFNEDIFNSIILQLFNRWFAKNLQLSIGVPILLVTFSEDCIPLTDNIQIRKLSNKELVSIYKIGGYSDTYEVLIMSCATHILELKGYSVPNTYVYSWCPMDHAEAYPIDIIDKFFAALSMTHHIQTGYGQVLSFPDEWGNREGNLIDIHGDRINKYNNNFKHHSAWLTVPPVLNNEDLAGTKELFDFLLSTNCNSINIAVKRLNQALVRENEDDAIIDLLIGIEALVTENDRGEISHKVSTRSAYILSLQEDYPFTIVETKKIVKKLYDYRSKVVHGTTISEKQKTIKIREDVTSDSIELAIQILKSLIITISKHPNLMNINDIDNYFMEE